MLTCLLGRAGAGKTEYIMSRVISDAAGLKKTILIVPEQFTFSAEWILTRALKSSGFLFTQVLSPTRLANRVLSVTGGALTRLDATGRAMAVKRALFAVRKDLVYYGRMTRTDGLASLMTDMITTLEQCDIAPAQIRALGDAAGGLLAQKTADIALVYDKYLHGIDGKYMDSAAQERLLIERLPQASFLRDYDIYVDGFDVIAPLTLHLIAKLALLCKSVTVTFTCGQADARDARLFRPVRDTLARLLKQADAMGVKAQTRYLSTAGFKSRAIGHLEKELFAYPAVPYAEPVQDISIIKAASTADESAMVAARIVALARDKGINYGDIAVICAETTDRPRELMRLLERRGVPCVLDRVETAATFGGARQLLAAFAGAMSGLMRREDAMGVLKSGCCGVDASTADLLENAIIEQNIFGGRFAAALADEGLESARAMVFDPVLRLSAQLRHCSDASDYAGALYNYCVESGLLKNLCDMGEGTLSKCICDILDQSHALLGEISAADFLRALKEGFAAAQLGSVPNVHDAVSISSIARYKGNRLRALFVMGLNDGVLPSSSAPDNLLSDGERESLGSYLGSSGSEFFAVENVTIYGALTEPRDFLCLSYSCADAGGGALEPSLLINRLQRIFPTMKIVEPERRMDADFMLCTDESTRGELGFMLKHSPDKAWHSVFAHYQNTDALFADRLRGLMGYRAGTEPLKEGQALKLFSNRISISRLETYAMCPYQHFVDYGLRPVPRRLPELTPIDSGIFYHSALEQFTMRAMAMGDALDAGAGEALMDAVTAPMCEQLFGTYIGRTHQGRAKINALRREMSIASGAVVNQLRKSGFRPRSAEISFGKTGTYPAIELDAGQATLFLEGRIDRLDVADINGRSYARIVDYKSGHNKLQFADVYTGKSLQLLTYLSAITAQTKYAGAGAFYMRAVGDYTLYPPEKTPQMDEIIGALNASYRLDGIMLGDMQVARAMIGSGAAGELVNIALNKNGSPRADAPVLSDAQFDRLLGYVKEKELLLAQTMLGGDIAPSPLTRPDGNGACRFCQYRALCHFDKTLGCRVKPDSVKNADAKKLILGEGTDNG